MFACLAEQLRTGDIAVDGADSYANWAAQLISPAQCAELLPGFCAEVGLPATARGFREACRASWPPGAPPPTPATRTTPGW